MSKLLIIIFIILTLLASVTASNAWTQELTDLVGNKIFWTSYEWQEIFEDSDFYKLSTWDKSSEKWRRSSETHFNSEVDKYIAKGSIGNLNIEQQISIKVDSAPPRTIFYLEFISHNEINNDDYVRLVGWCNEKFGKPFHSRVDKIESNNSLLKEKYISTWVLGNTIIGVVATPNQNILNGFVTSLHFERVGKTQSVITKPIDQPIPQKESAKSVPAIRATNKNILSIQTDSNDVKPTSNIRYKQQPYIWENESGVTNVTNDILNVPEDKRSLFEIPIQE